MGHAVLAQAQRLGAAARHRTQTIVGIGEAKAGRSNRKERSAP